MLYAWTQNRQRIIAYTNEVNEIKSNLIAV